MLFRSGIPAAVRVRFLTESPGRVRRRETFSPSMWYQLDTRRNFISAVSSCPVRQLPALTDADGIIILHCKAQNKSKAPWARATAQQAATATVSRLRPRHASSTATATPHTAVLTSPVE